MLDPAVEENVTWNDFKHVFFAPDMPVDPHKEIVNWIRHNGYGTKVFSGRYNGLYLFATDNDEIATHFKLRWIHRMGREEERRAPFQFP